MIPEQNNTNHDLIIIEEELKPAPLQLLCHHQERPKMQLNGILL
jgi:hypothetical protein